MARDILIVGRNVKRIQEQNPDPVSREADIDEYVTSEGYNPATFVEAHNKAKLLYGSAQTTPTLTTKLGETAEMTPETQTYLQTLKETPKRIWEGYGAAAKGMGEAITEGGELMRRPGVLPKIRGGVRAGLGTAGGMAGATFLPLMETVRGVIPQPKGEFGQAVVSGAGMGTALGGGMGTIIGGIIGAGFYTKEAIQKKLLENPKIAEYIKNNPDIIPDIDNAIMVGLSSMGGKKVGKLDTGILEKPLPQVPKQFAKQVISTAKLPVQLTGQAIGGAGKVITKFGQPSIEKATEIYRDILRPEKGEIKNIEIRKGKNINDYYKIAAEEGLSIKKTSANKLDTLLAREQLQPKQEKIYNQLNEALKSAPAKKFDLLLIGNNAKAELRNQIKNDTEYKSAAKSIDEYIADTIEARGRFLNGEELNNFKQGMWSVSYTADKPITTGVVPCKIGFIAKEMIEKGYPDINIKTLNEQSAKYITLQHLLENANGRVVKGGRLGEYFAKTTGTIIGGLIGSAIPIPGVGPAVGAVIGMEAGGKLAKYLTSPERLSVKAGKMARPNIPLMKTGKLLQTTGGYIESPTIPKFLKPTRASQRGQVPLGFEAPKEPITPAKREMVKEVPVAKKLEPLAVEARKYKSAEEFVEKYKAPFERGGEITEISGEAGQGIYAYQSNKALREYYTKKGEKLNFITPKTDAKIIDLTTPESKKAIIGIGQKKGWGTNSQNYHKELWAIKEYLYNKNYDAYILPHKGVGIPTGKQLVITNENKFDIKTKSQLIDFYNQAVGVKEVKPEVKSAEIPKELQKK